MTWQLIATAPKSDPQYGQDGEFLVSDGNYVCIATRRMIGSIDEWLADFGEGNEQIHPTHWQPIPDAPVSKDGGSK